MHITINTEKAVMEFMNRTTLPIILQNAEAEAFPFYQFRDEPREPKRRRHIRMLTHILAD
jgi:hypothetical protein